MVAPGHFPAVKHPGPLVRRDVQRQMAEDAIGYRKLVSGVCRACECGHPCPECVIDAQRIREYQEVLAGLGP